jgi:ubiquinone/menaquinone biosynthesis C-methylase UbiE
MVLRVHAAMYSPVDQNLEEFSKHQELLLPYTSTWIGRTNLDIGCGTGLTSVIHQQKLGISPTICDVIDIRHALARPLPFQLIRDEALPLKDNSFESSYIQYVLHHLPTSSQMARLLAEALRVSNRVIIVEEIRGNKTDTARAQLFDEQVNKRIHSDVNMPVYGYCTSEGIEELAAELNASVVFHRRISDGQEINGFLETHMFVISHSH